jgi:hypothetical protein
MAKERVVIINPVTSSLNAVYTYVAGVVWWGLALARCTQRR